MATMNGVDFSGYQPDNVLEQIPFDFSIIKLTQGNTLSNNSLSGQIQSAQKKGIYGVYHFDNGNDNWQGEVDTFLTQSSNFGVPGQGILFWDWEANAITKGVTRLSSIRNYLKSKLGYTAIYLSGSPAQTNAAEIKQWDYVWVAVYPQSKTVSGYTPQVTQTYWTSPLAHQYTSMGRLGTYNNNLDLNVAFLSADEWKAIAAKSLIGKAATPTVSAATTTPAKTNDQLATEVIQGLWGNGDDRKTRLTAAGYDYSAIQTLVNQKLGVKTTATTTPAKTNDQLATEVIQGLWGDGDDRKNRLTAAGYDYSAIQALVNAKLKK